MTYLNARSWCAYTILSLFLGMVLWAFRFPDEPAADFTFVNNTEVKSLDPAIVTGHPEGRVMQGLFEGLVNYDPRSLAPVPGIAERWEVSDDRLQYKFYLRDNARWSDNSPITSDDVVWSFQRLLDPQTAGQYSYQLWYVKNAKRYTTSDFVEGDEVEVELNEQPTEALPHARGKLLHGVLKKIEQVEIGDEEGPKQFTVLIDGIERVFKPGTMTGDGACKQVLLDFKKVGFQVLDKHTLTIELDNPTPYFISLMGFYPLFPVQKKCLETHGPNWIKPENLVTSGAFTLQNRKIRDRMRLAKSQTYWDKANVGCNTIDILAVESVVTGLNLYLTGEADWMTSIPTPIIPILRAQKRNDYHPAPELTVYFYRINCTKPPFNDKRVRQALAMAVNKQQVVDTVTRAGEIPARSFVPPGLPGYTPPQGPAYNPKEARRLLAAAGFEDGKGIKNIPLLYDTSDANQSIAELIQDQWKRTLGIEVTPYNQPWSTFQASQRNLDYTVCRAGWIGDYLDPNTFLDMFVTGGANNETGWGNAEYDRLIAEAAVEVDTAKRLQLFEQAEAILVDEAPIIPIYFRVNKNLIRPYIGGLYNNALDLHPLKTISIDQKARAKVLDDIRKGIDPAVTSNVAQPSGGRS